MNCPLNPRLAGGTLALIAMGAAPAAAQLGPRNYFHAEVLADVTYDSAVFGNNVSPDDTVFSVRPAISYERTYGIMHLIAKGGVQFNYFDEFDSENSEDIKSSIQLTFPNVDERRYYVDLKGSYNEFNEINSKVADLSGNRSRIHGEVTTADGLFLYHYTDRITSELFGSYQNTNIYDANFIGNETYEGGTNLVYTYSERWDLLGGYRYRHTDIEDFSLAEFPDLRNDEELNSDDHAIYIGARGVWNEKLETSARIGWQQRNFDSEDRGGVIVSRQDNDAIFFEAQARWQFREDILFDFTAIQDYNTTVDGRSNDETSFSAQMQKEWNPKLYTMTFVGYDIYRFSSNNDSSSDDTIFVARQGVFYSMWEGSRLFGEASWMKRDSDLEANNYTRYTLKAGFMQRF